jgi:hypothetical protein
MLCLKSLETRLGKWVVFIKGRGAITQRESCLLALLACFLCFSIVVDVGREFFLKKILSPMTNTMLGGIVWERNNLLCVQQ